MSAAPILDRDLPLDARAALCEANAASRAMLAREWGSAPWRRALLGMVCPPWDTFVDDPAYVAWKLFAADGACYDELLQMRSRDSRSWVRKLSHGKRVPRTASPPQGLEIELETERALANRLIALALGMANGVRHTHRRVHRALNGGPVIDALGIECEWCAKGSQ